MEPISASRESNLLLDETESQEEKEPFHADPDLQDLGTEVKAPNPSIQDDCLGISEDKTAMDQNAIEEQTLLNNHMEPISTSLENNLPLEETELLKEKELVDPDLDVVGTEVKAPNPTTLDDCMDISEDKNAMDQNVIEEQTPLNNHMEPIFTSLENDLLPDETELLEEKEPADAEPDLEETMLNDHGEPTSTNLENSLLHEEAELLEENEHCHADPDLDVVGTEVKAPNNSTQDDCMDISEDKNAMDQDAIEEETLSNNHMEPISTSLENNVLLEETELLEEKKPDADPDLDDLETEVETLNPSIQEVCMDITEDKNAMDQSAIEEETQLNNHMEPISTSLENVLHDETKLLEDKEPLHADPDGDVVGTEVKAQNPSFQDDGTDISEDKNAMDQNVIEQTPLSNHGEPISTSLENVLHDETKLLEEKEPSHADPDDDVVGTEVKAQILPFKMMARISLKTKMQWTRM